MFDLPKKYFYGSTEDHVVKLRPSEVAAVLKLELTPIEGTEDLFTSNLNPEERKAYSSGASKLNEYISKNGGVYCSDEDFESGNIIRPVKK